MKYYLAYGSNLNQQQMVLRCPTAEAVGQTVLPNHTLLFRGSQRNAVATLEPNKTSSVPVLVWCIEPADEDALEIYEGVPHLYRKEYVMVELDGKPIEALIYMMNEGFALGQPNCDYYTTILQGYQQAGFDTSVLKRAALDSITGGW